nr:5-methyltetrahydropteroyltriglutamate--homocysteine methyltransferase [Ipomoea batatas]
MVSELAGEGAMPLPTPASRRLEIAHHPRAVEEKPIEDVLSFPILLSDQIKDAIKEDDSFRLECSDDEEDRHNLIGDSEQRNGASSPGRPSFAIDGSKNRFVNPARFNFSCRKRFFPSIASNSSRSRSVKIATRVLVNPLFTVFNRSSRSRSVRSSAELVTPLFDLVSLSKVLVISLFTVFIRSRSAEILSAKLVAVASSPQRRTRKKKQLLTQIRDSGSRSVEFVNQPSVIDSACVGRSLAIQNSAMVCRLPYVNLFFAYVNRSRRGEQPVLDSDFACVDCNRVSAEQQVDAEPIKEEPENPPGKSTKKVKAGLSQYTIQKFVEEKQKTLRNAKNLNSEFAEFVEGAALHESPKDVADFSLIPEAVDDYQFGDSNEKFVFPFLPSSDKGGLSYLSLSMVNHVIGSKFDEHDIPYDEHVNHIEFVGVSYCGTPMCVDGEASDIESISSGSASSGQECGSVFAGVVDGRNIWANDLARSLSLLGSLEGIVGKDKLVVSTSCSLLHTAVDLVNETKLDDEIKSWLAFAAQKVVEVNALAKALAGQKDEAFFSANAKA